MRITKRKIVFEGKFLRVINKHFITKTGKKGVWEVVERKNLHRRIVVVFALTKNKEVILEKNYRVPLESYVIELPAGLTDKKSESEIQAAKRELFEETGFKAKKMIAIFPTVSSPGLLTSELVYFFAPDVEFFGQNNRESEEEEMEILKVPLVKLVDFLIGLQRSIKIDDKILGILPILKKKKLI